MTTSDRSPRRRRSGRHVPGSPERATGNPFGILLKELQRRRVLRVAGVYFVAAWLIIQIAATTFPALGLPERAVAFVIISVTLGFPIALALAWLFDFTPEGEIHTDRLALGVEHHGLTGSVFRIGLPLVGFVLLLATGGWIAARSWRAYEPAQQSVASQRIAVLYFDDHSPDQSLGPFSAGLTTSLITELQRVEQLHVISPNGVSPFRGGAVPVDSIARALNVGTLVGGSVSRSGDRVRVTASLIDGGTGKMLASHTSERRSADLFSLVDDVVQDVAIALRRRLGNEVRAHRWRAGTSSLAAWERLLEGVELIHIAERFKQSGDAAAAARYLVHADSTLRAAERADPRWPEPIVERALLERHRAFLQFERAPHDAAPVADHLAAGITHASRALVLSPQHAGALEARGVLRHTRAILLSRRGAEPDDVSAAESDLRAALGLDPGLARAWSTLSSILFYEHGSYGEARFAAERALAADAYVADATEILVRLFTVTFEGEDDAAATRWCDELNLRVGSRWPAAYCTLNLAAWGPTGTHDIDAAWRVLERAGHGDSPALRAMIQPRLEMLVAAVIARHQLADSARVTMRRALERAPGDREMLQLEAAVRLLLGDRIDATRLLERYLETVPSQRIHVAQARRFAPLQTDVVFRRITSAP